MGYPLDAAGLSGFRAVITITENTALTEMQALLVRLQKKPEFLREAGERMRVSVQDRILAGKRSPEGVPWAAWSARRRKEREAKGNVSQGLLWDTGALLQSIRAEVGAGDVSIGTDKEYASELQWGRDNMPARPYIGFSAADESELMGRAYVLFFGGVGAG